MINVRALANRFTSAVNPNTIVQYRRYVGYTILPTGKPLITYAPATPLVAQVQALTKKEVEHLDALNISTCERSAYANMQFQVVDRLTQKGGDFLYFENAWWLAMAVLEGWTTAGWCKVALTKQQNGPA